MASFADFAAAEPELAARVLAALDAHGHKILATLRSDGSPRVSGIEARVAAGELWLAGMQESVKFADLRRDPRMALHSGSDEPAEFTADAKLNGRAVEVTESALRNRFASAAGLPADDPFDLFHVELEQVVLVAVSDDRSALVISSWRPGRAVVRTERT
jgi:hypothetical protein